MTTESAKGHVGAAPWFVCACALHGLSTLLPPTAMAMAESYASAASLKKLSIEELMDIEVTSVSRAAERLGRAPAAIAVVTSEDIRRSGATSIPEALRWVPGLHVAQQNANSWAISSRGFSSTNSEKLLVLNDTRSIYTPLYSGVFWDVQDYLLQDIERIEVIRGPGATLWGSNAVNGVINITTKPARETQDLYLEAGSGTQEQMIAGARYGGTLGERGFFRVFGKYSDRDGTFHPGAQSDDDWRLASFGLRTDWELSAQDSLTVQGGWYEGDVGQIAPSVTIIGRPGPSGDLNIGVRGGHLLARWTRTIETDTFTRVRAYYDHTYRDDPSFIDELDTIDLDYQQGVRWLKRHALMWGVAYRETDNRNEGGGIFAVSPADSRDRIVSAFVQDRIRLTDDVRLTLGTKFEDNDFSGTEWQPSVRLTWDIAPEHMVWSAVSHAARVPTRLERDIAIDVTDPAGDPVVRLLGNRGFESEELTAYEAGYRFRPSASLSMDIAVFYNQYEDLASLEIGTPFMDSMGRTVVPIINQNLTDGRSKGIEALVTYSPLPTWRLSASYSYVDLDLDPRGDDLNRGELYEGATPEHQFALRSLLDLPGGLQLDVHFRHLDDIRQIPEIVTGEGIDGYSALDVRLAWLAWRQLEVSVVGKNLLDRRHVEFGTPAARGQIERSVYAKVAWGF